MKVEDIPQVIVLNPIPKKCETERQKYSIDNRKTAESSMLTDWEKERGRERIKGRITTELAWKY